MADPLVIFDGVCNLCNAAVGFIITHDRRGLFKFSPLQSEFSKDRLAGRIQEIPHPDSIVLIDGDRLYTESTAALRIARRLDGIWPVFYLLIAVPRPIRDFFYRVIAANRYRWFGKREKCMVPEPGIRERFIS